MSTLKDILPNITDDLEALAIARRAARASKSEDAALKDRLVSTAVEKDGEVHYRPYAAAHRWLAAHPKWIEKATGPVGAEYRTLPEVLKSLEAEQATLDAAFELDVPPHLKLSGRRAPGPTFASWR